MAATAIAAYPKEEQQPMTSVLIYMSGFLAVVATVLVVVKKTTVYPDR
jgi:hypothetical protein